MKNSFVKFKSIKSKIIKKKFQIGIIGYGIQGRAHALNLRDSGHNVSVFNINDNYIKDIKKDKFKVTKINDLLAHSEIIFFLIPDAVQENFYNKYLLKNLKEGQTLVFAHGFSLHYKTIKISKKINILLLAPRNPGKIVRDKYLKDSGSIAFYDIYQDYTKTAEKIVLTLAKDLGFIKGGLLKVSIEDETKIDLFIEQFMAPLFYRSVYESLTFLSSKGLNSLAASLELYLSGETGSVRLMQSKYGLYNALIKNASPTCQFGIASSYSSIFPRGLKNKMKKVFSDIENNKFVKKLEKDRSKNFFETKHFFKKLKKNIVSKNERLILK